MMGLSYRVVALVLAVLVAAVPGYCACEGHRPAAAEPQQKTPACSKCEKRASEKESSHSQQAQHCPTCKMTAEAKPAHVRVQQGAEIHLIPALLPAPIAMLTSILMPRPIGSERVPIPHRLMDLVHSSCQFTN